jgi:hypothetical protein
MSVAKAARLVPVRFAMRQIRSYFERRGEIIPNSAKRKDMIRRFMAEKGYPIHPDKSLYDNLTGLFYSRVDPDVSQAEYEFYASRPWKALRRKVLKHYGSACMKCGCTDEPSVDHIKPRSLFPALELEFSNMQVLCRPCNSAKSNLHETDYRMAA